MRCNLTDASRYYDPEASECRLCEGSVVAPLLTGVGGAVAVVALLLLWARFKPLEKVRLLRQWSMKVQRLGAKLSVRAKAKQLLGFLQVATRISDVYGVPMPDAVARLLSFFELLNINIDGIGLPLQCMGLGTFSLQLATTMLLPVAIAALLVLGFAVRGCCSGGQGLGAGLLGALPSLLLLSFLCFPLVSSTSFRVFSCEPFDDGRAFLRAECAAASLLLYSSPRPMPCCRQQLDAYRASVVHDRSYSVECGSVVHDNAKRLAWLGLALYPGGISLMYMLLMWRARHAIRSGRATALSRALSFVVRDFEKDCTPLPAF